ncbi:hypothetical protein [Oxynema aestuarii]|uniref:Uncharacterized protein n=1 Tax=Oxynema aestuarii AP17 TaxID=2064643 RepID=A0A6H1U5J9_9CYAN|nr:hypothetical protein [Oxynema aestuarii]QIZ73430.1 hypothetical protein HCG48_24850 [Oxynema aestuarii AP17]
MDRWLKTRFCAIIPLLRGADTRSRSPLDDRRVKKRYFWLKLRVFSDFMCILDISPFSTQRSPI